jgi:glycine cleavage system aminomethyltransferase T
MAYLPAPVAEVGTPLLTEYLGEHYPVTVASHGAVFDPAGERMR